MRIWLFPTLRYASGDEDIRAALYEQLGDALFEDTASVRKDLQKLVVNWGQTDSNEDGDAEQSESTKKSLPDAKKRKLLNEDTWKRDALLVDIATQLREKLGDDVFEDHNELLQQLDAAVEKLHISLSAPNKKLIVNAVSWRNENAAPVIKRVHVAGKGRKSAAVKPDPLRGFFEAEIGGKTCVVEYEPESELRHFYQPPQLRTLAEISADILALEQETEGLLSEITKGVTA